MSSTVGTTWLATVVGLGGLFGLLFTVGAAKQLYRLHKIQAPDNTIAPDPNNPLPTRHPPVKKVKIALCLILVALLLFIIRICVILANFVTMSNPPRYGICVLDTASCREGRRQDHEWSLEVGRISYAQGFFTIVGLDHRDYQIP
ncbi:hypothetical protein QBC34DRAFT_499247 [Podospora aff. communis PSN243]|uniref:Uncharacterized protein n=1 Tax=Podospora aff. communis PSN243 TaxID=3040156 RepID=A0AAV9G6M8_9PEZI|nr:hypothetical protein QBC34DRAFT_499247 [Podospora aff. communis PSN243]